MTSTGTGISHSEYNRNPAKPVHFLQVSLASPPRMPEARSPCSATLTAVSDSLQIWGLPSQSRLPPSYYNRHFSDDEKRDKLVRVVAPVNADGVKDERDTDGPAPVSCGLPAALAAESDADSFSIFQVHANLSMFASILSPKSSVKHELAANTTKAYLHNIMRSGYRGPSTAASDKFEDGGAMVSVNGGLILEEGDGAFVEVRSTDGSREIEVKNVGERDAEWLLFEMAD